MSTYVYGIVRASHPALPEGLEGIGEPPQPVRVLPQGEVAAIISDLSAELRPKRRHLLAHQRVVDAAGAGGVVLPMRFGNVSPDDDTVSSVLSDHTEEFLQQLDALDGRTEYNLKANHDEEAVLRLVTAENPEIKSLAEANREAGGGSHQDQLRLGEMIATAVQARETEDADLVRQALEPAAEAVSPGPQSSGWLTNLSFLVERSSADRFRTAVDTLGQKHPHLELRLSGPMPPYSFVSTPSDPEPED
ncbi:GvpL/GvpF family gas vesicle protein [Streptomyces sp. NPDC005017]|uniref:GvpL/GvpF family gas vesicle protein n=1 Tax=Streptomyces sp. NPDC005017 TaxID=3364706 RepID=UPI0036989453